MTDGIVHFRKDAIMLSRIKSSYLAGFMLLGLLIVVPSCTHRETHQIGSHKVTVARHGLLKNSTSTKRSARLNMRELAGAVKALRFQ